MLSVPRHMNVFCVNSGLYRVRYTCRWPVEAIGVTAFGHDIK